MPILRLAEMKGSCTLVASVLTASTAALTSSASADPACASHPRPKQVQSSQLKVNTTESPHSRGKEKFAPRFDGLRFIETLVTAHR